MRILVTILALSLSVTGQSQIPTTTWVSGSGLTSALSCQDAGVTDAYACNLSPVPTAYVTGNHYHFKANTANTGAATINFNALGAVTIKKPFGGSITTDLNDNDIKAGQWVDLLYDGTNMQMTSQIANPLSGTSPVTVSTTNAIGCATCVTSASALTSNNVVLGGGGQATSVTATDTTTTHALFATAGAPAFRAVAGADLRGVNLAAVSQLSKTALVSTFTVCAATAGTACGQVGQYRISYSFWGSGTACSSVTAGSVGLGLTWTDENAVAHSVISMPMWDQKAAALGILFNFNTALGTEGASGIYVISTNGTIIQAATTYTACTTGTGTYNLRMTVEQLQ
jgi:hypothetical protein